MARQHAVFWILMILSFATLLYGVSSLAFFGQTIEGATMYYPAPVFFAILALFVRVEATTRLFPSRILLVVSIALFVAAYGGLVYYRWIAPHQTVTQAWNDALAFISIVSPFAILFGVMAVLIKS